MTSFIIAGSIASLAGLVTLLRVTRRGQRRQHGLTVQEALASMSAALDAEVPQQALLREMAWLLTEQDRAALALEARLYALLPEAATPGPDAAPAELLTALAGLAEQLRKGSRAITVVEASVMGMVDQAEPQEAVWAFVAEHSDLSRDTLARAQFVHPRDHTRHVPDSLILRAALRQYGTDISADAIRLFVAEAGEYAGRSAELHFFGSTRQAARNVFRWGVSALPAQGQHPDHDQPLESAAHGETGPAPAASAHHAEPELRLDHVFAFPPAGSWRASAMAYMPFFGFVVNDLRELCLLDETSARLQAAVQELLADVTGAGQTSEMRGTGWPSGPPDEVIGALIGRKIASIVRARWLTWSMSDCHRTLTAVLAEADIAAQRLVGAIGDGLALVRAAYLAEIGHVPRLDTIGSAAMADVAAQLQETGELHVQLARLLIADAGTLPGSGQAGAQLPGVSRLWGTVRAADQAMRDSRAALSAGSYLEAVRSMLGARLPLRPDGFPGSTFYHDLLAQARPMTVLAITHRMAVARWAALALNAFFRSREAAAEMISRQVDGYGRAYGEMSLATNASLTVIGEEKL
jgi:hypothetical protein